MSFGCQIVIDKARAPNTTSPIYAAEKQKQDIYSLFHTKASTPLIVHAHLCSWLRLSPITCCKKQVPLPPRGAARLLLTRLARM